MFMIKCDNLYVRYLKDCSSYSSLKEFVFNVLNKKKSKEKYFMALKNINFEISKGDMLGIIGTNGAGKSSLLKVISGVMKPFKGIASINGQVTALLELATGFDPDLTVKENVYLRAALLGFDRNYTTQEYNNIIKFAELEEHQHVLFRNLSSGMQSRLGFSISSLIRPEILILDEVLAVGDGGFREKSKNKIKEIINNGSTCIIVSHSIHDIRMMCNKILWLDKGSQVIFTDDIQTCCNAYEEFLSTKILPATKEDLLYLSNKFIERTKFNKQLNDERDINTVKNILSKLSVDKVQEIIKLYEKI